MRAGTAAATEHCWRDPWARGAAGGDPAIPVATLGVQADYLEAAFDEMEQRYGTIEQYFAERVGIDAAGQYALRAIYLAAGEHASSVAQPHAESGRRRPPSIPGTGVTPDDGEWPGPVQGLSCTVKTAHGGQRPIAASTPRHDMGCVCGQDRRRMGGCHADTGALSQGPPPSVIVRSDP